MKEITVIGSINMDMTLRCPHLPKPGETIICERFVTEPGGKGANQAVAASKLGAKVRMVGQVGEDDFGNRLRTSLEQSNVNIGNVVVNVCASTGIAIIEIDEYSGENCIAVISGANSHVLPENIENIEDVIASSEAVILQLEIPQETVIRCIQMAHEKKVKIFLNAAPVKNIPEEIYPFIDVLIVNEVEASVLSQINICDFASCKKAASMLHEKGCNIVIITLGAGGAYYYDFKNQYLVPSFDVNVVDTTGAGDAFVGGFVVAYVNGCSLHDAVVFGNAAGALAATKNSAQPSMPNICEIEEFLEKQSKQFVLKSIYGDKEIQ